MPMQSGSSWRQAQPSTHARGRPIAQRQPFNAMDTSFRTSVSTTRSDHSDSTAEVENLLAQTGRQTGRNTNSNNFNANIAVPQRASAAQATPRGK